MSDPMEYLGEIAFLRSRLATLEQQRNRIPWADIDIIIGQRPQSTSAAIATRRVHEWLASNRPTLTGDRTQ